MSAVVRETTMRRNALGAVLAAVLAVAATSPAAARPVQYVGKTSAGDRIAFTLRGERIAAVSTSTPTSCVPTEGAPRVGTDLYRPPGTFALGVTAKVQTPAPAETAMHYSPVSKWFHFSARRAKRGAITGTLHQNYSFESIASDSWSGVRLVGWVCQGHADFSARPVRPRSG